MTTKKISFKKKSHHSDGISPIVVCTHSKFPRNTEEKNGIYIPTKNESEIIFRQILLSLGVGDVDKGKAIILSTISR